MQKNSFLTLLLLPSILKVSAESGVYIFLKIPAAFKEKNLQALLYRWSIKKKISKNTDWSCNLYRHQTLPFFSVIVSQMRTNPNK